MIDTALHFGNSLHISIKFYINIDTYRYLQYYNIDTYKITKNENLNSEN